MAESGVEKFRNGQAELDWQTRQQIQRIENLAAVDIAYEEAARGRAMRRAETAVEDNLNLATQMFEGLVEFDRLIDRVPRNSALEFLGRELQMDLVREAKQIAQDYRNDRRGR